MILNDGHREAVLTATSEAAGLEIENTQDERRALVWRSEDTSGADATDQEITAVMPVTISGLGGMVLSNTNLTTAATVSVALKNGMTTVDTVALDCIEENLDGTTTWVAYFEKEDDIDQYALTIDDPTNTDGYLQIVQIMCGPVLTTEYNPAYGAEMEWSEDVEHYETDGGTIRSEGTGQHRRRTSINLELVPEADRAALVAGLMQHGQRFPLFLSLYPGNGTSREAQYQYVCKRLTNIRHQHWTQQFFRQGIEFSEC